MTSRPAALLALVPSGVNYIPREVPGGHTDFEVLEYALQNNKNVLLEGPTGAAKTTMLRAFAEKHGLAFINVKCSGGADPDALFGTVELVNGNTAFTPGDLTLAAMHGDALINLDEVNALPPRLSFIFHDAFDDRRALTIPGAAGGDGGSLTVKIAPNVLIVGAYNPGYAGTTDLNAAFANRFAIKLSVDYDPEVEKTLVESSVLVDIAEQLRRLVKNGDLETPVSTNRLMTFDDLVYDLSYEFAVSNFVSQFSEDERGVVREVFANADDALRASYGVELVIDPGTPVGA